MADEYKSTDEKPVNVPQGNEPMAMDDPAKPIQISGATDGTSLLLKIEKCVKDTSSLFEKWDTWRRPYENLWSEIYRLYMCVVSGSKTPTRAKIFIPIVFQVIETAVSKFISIIFGNEEFFEVVPDDPKDAPQAEVIHKLLMYQLGRVDFFLKFVDFCKQLLLYGTSYFKVYWKVRREWVWSRTPIRQDVSILGFKMGSKITGWEEKKEYKVVERRPEVEVIDILDVYPDPNAATEKQGRGVFIRSWIDIDDLKQMGSGRYPIYSNTDDERLKQTSKSYGVVRQERYSARGVSDPSVQTDASQVELLEFWGRYDLDGDGIKEECLITLGNRQVLLRAVPNPFHHQKRPIVKCALFPVPMEWFGIGLIEPIVPLQHELNTVRRQRLDNVNLIINRMWKVNSLADVDLDTLVSTPNGIVLTDDMTAVEALPTLDVTNSAYTDAATIQSDIENVTVPRSVQGIPENGRLGRTARGAQLIIGQALEKFATSARLMEDSIKRVLRMMHQLNLQFIDSENVVREIGVVGHLFDEVVTPEMIRAEVRFSMVGISDMIDKESKINRAVSFVGIFKNVLAPDTLTMIAQKVWKWMGNDPDEIQSIMAQLPQPGAVLPDGSGSSQNEEAAVQGQAQKNGTSAPVSVPGARPVGQ